MMQAFGYHINVAFTSVTPNDLWYSTPSQPDYFFLTKFWDPWMYFSVLGNFCFKTFRFGVSALGNDLEIEKLMGSRSKEKVWKADVS